MDKNYYEILGLTEEEIAYFLNKSEELSENESSDEIRDDLIKKAYEKRKAEIEEEYKKEQKNAEEQYELKNQLIEYGKKANSNTEVNEERIRKSFEANKSNYDRINEELNKTYEINIKKLEYAYEQLKSEQLRRAYNELLDIEVDDKMLEIANAIEEKYRIDKYNKQDQYNPELLKTINEGNLSGEKTVIRKPTKEPIDVLLNDERNMKVKHTATVHYKNVTDALNSYINEYEITRNVDGQEKVDIVYTEIDLLRLGFNKKRNKLVDPNYYDCVVNKLFSEEAIKGSKFNGGYIGLIRQMPDGKFDTTIDKEEVLSVEEQENLAAIMILKEREERQNIDNQELEGESR